MGIAQMIDHTLLKAQASKKDIAKLCAEAKEYGFASVCVNPCYVAYCVELLQETDIKVCTVIGFPLGATTKESKEGEARQAVQQGASELDMVINIGNLKDKEYHLVLAEIKAIVEIAKPEALVKVIIEACFLTEEEKEQACLLAQEAGAHFVKTSTGFGSGGAIIEDVQLMRRTVGKEMGVKASGGIRDCLTAEKMLKAGASRLGTSSGIAILEGNK